MKICPHCGEEQLDELTNCLACGKFLNEVPKKTAPVNGMVSADSFSSAGKLMGDKNVIAGDVHVIGSQDTYHTTNIINQDETKKVVICHICGRNVTVDNSVDCPFCLQKTCEKCFDFSAKKCQRCVETGLEQQEKCYEQELADILASGRITAAGRQRLEHLRIELKITPEKAAELENAFKNNNSFDANNDALSMFEKTSFNKAVQLLYEDNNAVDAWNLLRELYQEHSYNEDIISLLSECAEMIFSPEETLERFSNLKADILGVKLAELRISLMQSNVTVAEKQLAAIEKIWNNNLLVTYHKILCQLAMADKLNEDFFVQQAQLLFLQAPKPQTKLERSWHYKIECSIDIAWGNEPSKVTADYCKTNDLYYAIASTPFIGANKKEKINNIRGKEREEIIPSLIRQYCSGEDFTLQENTSLKLCGTEFCRPAVQSTNLMVEEFIKNVHSGDCKAAWCRNGVRESCDDLSCDNCILSSEDGNTKQKIAAFLEMCKNLDIECPDPDEDIEISRKKAEQFIAEQDDAGEDEQDDAEAEAEFDEERESIVSQLVEQYCSGEDYTIKAGQISYDDEDFNYPDICSTNLMVKEFIENVSSGTDEACWCHNGVIESCDEIECENCLLCSNKGDAETKIMVFKAFCESFEIDCPDPDEEY